MNFKNPQPRWGRALLLLALSIPTLVHAQSDQAVFTDAYQNGWENWGWADIRLATSPVHSGSQALSVTATAYQAIYSHHIQFDSTLYSKLRFWIHGGPQGGQRLLVQATLNQVEQPRYDLQPLAANQWTLVEIPLADLGAQNKTNLDGFWIKDSSGTTQPTFYVDDITLVAVPPPPGIQLNVNASQNLRTIDDRMFALNGSAWDTQFSSSSTVSQLADIGARALRYPGGSMADSYHWRTNTTDSNLWTWATSFDAFATTARQVGSQGVVTVNYGSGTPQEAADWVQYSNVTKGYGVKYWEVGNENFGAWERDDHLRPHDPYTYAQQFKQYYDLMKAIDPSVKVGMVGIMGEDEYSNYTDHPAVNPRTGVTHNGWTPVVLATLKSLGCTPDMLIFHKYQQGPFQEIDSELLMSTGSWSRAITDIRQQLNDYLGSTGPNVEIFCTECNSVYDNPGKQTTSIVNALWLADVIGQNLQTELKGFVWWGFHGGPNNGGNLAASLYGWRQYGDYGIVSPQGDAYPTYYIYKMLKNWARGGDSVVQTSTSFPSLTVYGAKRADGSLGVMVVNKDALATYQAQINLAGFTPDPNATVYSYGLAQDEAARTGTGIRDVVSAPLTVTGTTIGYTFPPYSVTVVSLRPASQPSAPAAPSALVATAASNSVIGITWSDNSSNETGFAIERSLDGTTFAQVNTVGANVVSFRDPGLMPNRRYYYRVRAYNGTGYSGYSNVDSARTSKR